MPKWLYQISKILLIIERILFDGQRIVYYIGLLCNHWIMNLYEARSCQNVCWIFNWYNLVKKQSMKNRSFDLLVYESYCISVECVTMVPNDYNKITSIITAIDIINLSDLFYVERISVSQEIQVKQSYLYLKSVAFLYPMCSSPCKLMEHCWQK